MAGSRYRPLLGKAVLVAILVAEERGFRDGEHAAQYVKDGVGELDQAKLPHLLELRYRAVNDAAAELGGVGNIRNAFVGFQGHLYE